MKKLITTTLTLAALAALTPFNAGAWDYTVQENDCWWSISEYTATDFWSLMAVNNADIDTVICPGDTVQIPDGSITASVSTSVPVSVSANTYTVQPNDGWYAIAEKLNIDVYSLLTSQGATLDTMLYVGDVLYLDGSQSIATSIPASQTFASSLLGSRTLYNYPSGNSWYNICHAADMLNGVVVYPWTTFSMYDQFPNQAGYADGFKDAGAFGANGELVQSPGGGICFVSTTFYQCAVYDCGLQPVSRYDHMDDVGYAVRGTDAAVNFFADKSISQDMAFFNNTNHTLRFNFSYDCSGALTVSCYIIG